MDRHAFPFESDETHKVQEECLASPILADDEAHRRSGISDAVYVADECTYLLGASHLDVLEAYPRHNACGESLDYEVPILASDCAQAATPIGSI